jgi:hypothetical protein
MNYVNVVTAELSYTTTIMTLVIQMYSMERLNINSA